MKKYVKQEDEAFFEGYSLNEFRARYETMEKEIRFLLTHVRFEPNSNTNRKDITDGIPNLLKLMGWEK
jgi:hypothetical protein